MLKFVLAFKPVTKKNHSCNIVTKTGRIAVIPSKAYREFEKKVIEQVETLFGNLEPIDYPINLCAIFYKDRKCKSDLVGYEQALCDALVKAGLLVDDNTNIVKSMDGSRVEYDKENPRIDIVIERYKDE